VCYVKEGDDHCSQCYSCTAAVLSTGFNPHNIHNIGFPPRDYIHRLCVLAHAWHVRVLAVALQRDRRPRDRHGRPTRGERAV
jgi:hypothetical protein